MSAPPALEMVQISKQYPGVLALDRVDLTVDVGSVPTNILQANPDLAAIYACNDTMALGAVEAVKAAGLEGKVAVIGTDAIPEAIDAIKAGRMTGTVAQYPYEIAFLAVESAVKVHEGRPISARIDAPIQLLTAANLP